MCHIYLKKNFQRTSNALIKYIPAGVVMVDAKGLIVECNRLFAEMAGALGEYDALGNLDGLGVDGFMPDFQQWNDRIVTISVFPISVGKFAGAVVQDVTKNEGRREEIAAKARDVIRKNVYTVQQVARLFGEHIAETEIMLNEIAGAYESQTVGKRLRQGGSEEYLNG